ncbi:MAG: Gfo/Idh/MocA family oxidoreductase [Anaerolineales bacterium]|nr:Gfo/Idh/MocA family oxidoreductase [Anaerolineales bacterium]MCS7248450.1 Gfo/Idh/MocA family oxidoreductase [Anaerolineales bacterium]MDW8162263.1 Gfo/Idh/MocA family oxidoreductase [Anaerolineales bacterium]MDW8447810.1 Gfo/Idh/MocA family oxidoreductase [Anaerolineales bacterium]
MKFLIIGFGSIGRRHAQNLIDLGETDLLVYRTGHSTLPLEMHLDLPVETDLERALAFRPDAVIVCNPTALHLPVSLRAVRQGCHLFLEKPISHTLEGVDELQRLVEQKGVKVLVGFQYRFHPAIQTIRSWLREGKLGRPLWARVHWGEYLPDWHPWEDYRRSYSARRDLGGGVLLTLCHPFDYLHDLFGKATHVSACVGMIGDLELDVEDTAEVILHYAHRFMASVHLDYLQRPASHTLEIYGTRGKVTWNYHQGLLEFHPIDAESELGSRLLTFSVPAHSERNEMYRAEMAHFLRVIRGEEPPACSLEDGIYALRVALAAHQAATTGVKTPISPTP